MEERLYWLGFSAFSGIGPVRFKQIINYFGDAKSAWTAGIHSLIESGIGERTSLKFDSFRKDFSLKSYYSDLKSANVSFLTLADPDYPHLLSDTINPPIVLYFKGIFNFNDPENQKTIAVVGTRRITNYGSHVTRLLVSELVDSGAVIVSGLALGVDSIAHETTLRNDGKTIAVLGSGVDCCFPAQNKALYERIIKSRGVIVSEFPLGQTPLKGSFPSRNRIIAGLSRAVLVTEGSKDSGALITAENAIANKRQVYAVPGPITSAFSGGPNSLIAKGARSVLNASDIVRSMDLKKRLKTTQLSGCTNQEQIILKSLQNNQMHIDEIIKLMNIPAAQIGTILTLMEIKGLIQSMGSGVYAINKFS